jgi:addiction module HigA family antidote
MARTPIHPGEHLAQELTELRMSAAELARQIDVAVNRVTGIINGQRAVTADTALRLGHWFDTSPEFWLNLQNIYELRLAREEIGDRAAKLSPARGPQARTRKSRASPALICRTEGGIGVMTRSAARPGSECPGGTIRSMRGGRGGAASTRYSQMPLATP